MTLPDADRRLCRLTCALVLGDWDAARAVHAEAAPDEPDRRWREAVLQVHVFAGYPRLVEAYAVLSDAGGLGVPEPDEVRSERGPAEDARRAEEEHARGRELFDAIYREHADRLRSTLAGFHVDFADWLEGHAYGRVLARPGLAADRRELLAVCALAALDQGRQLASHARGAIRLGVTRAELDDALTAIAGLLPEARLAEARRIVARFR